MEATLLTSDVRKEPAENGVENLPVRRHLLLCHRSARSFNFPQPTSNDTCVFRRMPRSTQPVEFAFNCDSQRLIYPLPL